MARKRRREAGDTYRCRVCKRWLTIVDADVASLHVCGHTGEREATEQEIAKYKSGMVDVDITKISIDNYDPRKWKTLDEARMVGIVSPEVVPLPPGTTMQDVAWKARVLKLEAAIERLEGRVLVLETTIAEVDAERAQACVERDEANRRAERWKNEAEQARKP